MGDLHSWCDQDLRNSSGSLAKFAAIRRASSLVSSLAADYGRTQQRRRAVPQRTRAAGSGVQASPRPPHIKADPDHASDQKRTAKHGAGEIDVVARTVWQAPAHAGKQAERFGDVGEDHDCQTNEAQ